MTVRRGLRPCGSTLGSWHPALAQLSLFSDIPQPSAPSLALMGVSAQGRTSANAPPAGEESTATWVSRMGTTYT